MIRQLTRPLLRPLMRPLVGKGGSCERWVYDFDGVNDFAQFGQRLIDPEGDIDIEIQFGDLSGLVIGTEYALVSQCESSTFNNKEFRLYLNSASNAVQMQIGGTTYSGSTSALRPPSFSKLRVTLIGSDYTVQINDAILFNGTLNRGAAREPFALTRIGADRHGAGFRAFFLGIIRDININGQLYPINNPASATQASVPDNGNPLTLFNTNQGRWSKIPC